MHLGMKKIMLVLSVVFGALVLGSSSMAGAQSDPSGAYVGDSPEVLNETVELQPAAQAAGSSTSPEVQSSALAFTGGDAATLALLGGGAVLAGGMLVMARRRSTVEV